jgi:MerR family transcriptional regulator/heat shock protein HspR
MRNRNIESVTPVYTLSTTSTLSGIPVHSIRQYMDRGLILPYKKESKRNLFSQVDITRLKYIHKLLVEDGLNIAGIRSILALIPCWAIRNCHESERLQCKAFHSDSYPCWDASEKGASCRNSDCRECAVYRIVEDFPDLKSFLKTLL